MDCDICMEQLDSAERRPKCIPCGHTVCLHCVSRMGKRMCPQCRQEFAEPVGSLPDNFFLLKLIEKEGRCLNQRLWCRDCSSNATKECEDGDHALCSVRKQRAEQAAERLQRLQDTVTAVWKAVGALEDTKGSVDALLGEWRARLRRLEDAEKQQRAAVDAGRDTVKPMQVDPAEQEGLRQLQDAASLLQARCALQVQLQEKVTYAGLQQAPDCLPGAPRSPPRRDGAADKPMLTPKSEAPQSEVVSSPECLDVAQLCLRKDYCQEMGDILQDPGLAKVRRLVGLVCANWAVWCEALLLRAAPRLECLSLRDARPDHLAALGRLPALRHLHVHVAADVADVPHLPLQLESLDLTNVRRRHLECVQCMPGLRKLALDCSDTPLDVAFPPLPPHHCGLRWLWVALRPLSSVLSLAKAHAATLQDLRVTCASEGDSPWHLADLADGLQRCRLTALRSVVLLRRAPGLPDHTLPHAEDSCRKQKRAVWINLAVDLLAAVEDPAVTISLPQVLCGECDNYPAYPSRGLPWEDN